MSETTTNHDEHCPYKALLAEAEDERDDRIEEIGVLEVALDALSAKLTAAEAVVEREKAAWVQAMAELKALRARLAAAEAVVEAAREQDVITSTMWTMDPGMSRAYVIEEEMYAFDKRKTAIASYDALFPKETT